jgi:hypothetical protein
MSRDLEADRRVNRLVVVLVAALLAVMPLAGCRTMGGAAVGAGIGAIAGDAGMGAAVGASVGLLADIID